VALDDDDGDDIAKDGTSSWRAQVWRLSKRSIDVELGALPNVLENVSSFHGGPMADRDGLPPLMRDVAMGSLRAAEIASIVSVAAPGTGRTSGSKLLLCSLTDAGYVMTHVRSTLVSALHCAITGLLKCVIDYTVNRMALNSAPFAIFFYLLSCILRRRRFLGFSQ
jgi:hypothetical protein